MTQLTDKLDEIFKINEWLKTSKNVVHLPFYKKTVQDKKGKDKEVMIPGITWADLYEAYILLKDTKSLS